MFNSIISSLVIVFLVLCSATQATAAIILLRNRGVGQWIILGGSVITLAGLFAFLLLPVYLRSSRYAAAHEIYYIPWAMIALGLMLSCVGLLLYAFDRRREIDRVAELEAILATIQKS
jgi:hypothetical protein